MIERLTRPEIDIRKLTILAHRALRKVIFFAVEMSAANESPVERKQLTRYCYSRKDHHGADSAPFDTSHIFKHPSDAHRTGSTAVLTR